jgi:hypothetical protein
MVKQQSTTGPHMMPQRPQVQRLSPEHQQYVEWDQSKLQQAQKESMEPTTSQVSARKNKHHFLLLIVDQAAQEGFRF